MNAPQHRGGIMNNKRKPGPDPERLKLPFRDWKEAIREALKRERPTEGWPEDREPEQEDETAEDS